MPGSIFGGDHRNRVAAARGRPPGWGIPGHANYMLPATRGMNDPSYVSPLMGGLLQNQGVSPPGGPMGSVPGPRGSVPGPMGSVPGAQGPKFGNQTGPVNPGGPSVGMAGQGGMSGMFGIDTSNYQRPFTGMGPGDNPNYDINGNPVVGGSIPVPPKDTSRQRNALREALMSRYSPPRRNFSIGRR